MNNELVLFNKSFNISENKVLKYLQDNTIFVLKTDWERFTLFFTLLYELPIFKSILNVILTELKNKNARFILEPVTIYNEWNRLAGHCDTQFIKNFDKKLIGRSSTFEKGFFTKKYTIVLRYITPPIIIHEIGHAIEHISGIDIEKGFRENFGTDMKAWNCSNIMLTNAVKNIMVEELKGYPLVNVMAELFARFFEVLSISKEVAGMGDYCFTYQEVSRFFSNTIGWFYDRLEPILIKKTDKEVAIISEEFISNLKPYRKKFIDTTKSRFANVSDTNKKFEEVYGENKRVKDDFATGIYDIFEKSSSQSIKKTDTGVEYFEFKRKN
ncbi:MAG: hypothetical protein LBG48_01325 [Rickettsiales bacterium]|jgi:hypothetical protein|nr:hypothetical protein [Rickettsiales bacterium]